MSSPESSSLALLSGPARMEQLVALNIHLVMNAMNRLVARDAALNLPENPLLFTLSDYLRASWLGAGTDEAPVPEQLRRLDAGLRLHADMTQISLDVNIHRRPDHTVRIAPGALASAVQGILDTARPRAGTQWTLDLHFQPHDGTAPLLRFSVILGCGGDAAAAQLPAASQLLSALQRLPWPTDGVLTLDGPTPVYSPRPGHIGCHFSARLLEPGEFSAEASAPTARSTD